MPFRDRSGRLPAAAYRGLHSKMDYALARKTMVDTQVRPNNVTEARLIHALGAAPREVFAPSGKAALAYSELEIETSPGRWLLTPRDFSKLIAVAEIQPTDAVLDIACGSGYSTAVAAQLAETVVGLDADADVVSEAEARLRQIGVDNAVVIQGDVEAGAPDQGPFNVILVCCGAARDLPALKAQLADGGRLVFVRRDGPVGRATVVVRAGDHFGERTVFDCQAPVAPEFAAQKSFVF